MANIKNVLIIGGGVAGLTTAIALAKHGISAEVVEQNPDWSVYGVGIIQPSNMLRALRSIGMGDACLAQGRGFKGWQFCDSNGQKMAEVPSHNVAGEGYPAANGITRSGLHKILCDATVAQGTPVHLGVTVTEFAEHSDGVEVSFSNGKKQKYELVIGSDGLNSHTRKMLFGDRYPTQLTGQSVWRYNFERPRDLNWGTIFYGKKSKAGLVPIGDALMYMFLVTAEPGNPRMPAEQMHTLLRERMAEYGGLMAQLREQVTDPAGVVYRPIEVVTVPEPWHVGHVVLIGDAVHAGTPHLAQGASMAIEDSVLLAELLQGAGDLQTNLKDFASRRAPRAKLVYETGIQLGDWEMQEWSDPSLHHDHGALFGKTYAQLMQPI